MPATFDSDHELVALLARLKVEPQALLGHGGEAWVFAYGSGRVLRVLHPGGTREQIARSHQLVAELSRAPHRFELPELIDIDEFEGRVFSIERRLPGRSLLEELAARDPSRRPLLIEALLATAAALGDLHLEDKTSFGDLLSDDAVTSPTWNSYLVERAARSMRSSTLDLAAVDAGALADDLPSIEVGSFLHLDLYPGNVLTDGTTITAVIDFGATCAVGDRRLDPLSAVVYLEAPEISPPVVASDIDVARSWLRAAGIESLLEPARRWLAAFWSRVDDPPVLRWCQRVLAEDPP